VVIDGALRHCWHGDKYSSYVSLEPGLQLRCCYCDTTLLGKQGPETDHGPFADWLYRIEYGPRLKGEECPRREEQNGRWD